MKVFGVILLAIGVGLLIYVAIDTYLQGQRILSPIPRDDGVKVIIITPTIKP